MYQILKKTAILFIAGLLFFQHVECARKITKKITKKIIKTYLPEHFVVVEAGACNGSDTAEMAKLWPNSKIHAFEPVPALFAQLKNRVKNHKNVACYTSALSNQAGSATFYVSSGTSDASSSLLKPKEHLTVCPTVLFEKEIIVKTIMLDDWAKQHKIEKVDFLWLDMQGSELTMLKAAPKILKTVRVIQMEVSIKELYETVPLYSEVRKWLEQQGFAVVLADIDEARGWGDVLFVRKKAYL